MRTQALRIPREQPGEDLSEADTTLTEAMAARAGDAEWPPLPEWLLQRLG